jgi:hypothetical protein
VTRFPVNSLRQQSLDKESKMSKFLLLTPIDHSNFQETSNNKQLMDYLKKNFDCEVMKSLDVNGVTKYYPLHANREGLLELCESMGLDGVILKYTSVYDQVEETN